MPLRDVTAILMGDPGTHPRRHPTPEQRVEYKRELSTGIITNGRQANNELIERFAQAPVGFETKVKAYYHARKVWLWGQSVGVTIEYEHVPGTEHYVVRRLT